MISRKIKLSILLPLCFICIHSYAYENQEMANFFSVEKNQRGFKLALAIGQIRKGKEKMVNACFHEKKKKVWADCECVKREIENVSDKEFFYESVLAYQRYQEKVEALENEDREKYEELKKVHSERNSLSKRLENACGKI